MAETRNRKQLKHSLIISSKNGHVHSFKFPKLLDPDVNWDKDQLCDVLHWIRQGLRILIELIWGAIPLIGAIWIVFSWHSGRFLIIKGTTLISPYAGGLPGTKEKVLPERSRADVPGLSTD